MTTKEKNDQILAKRLTAFNTRTGPRVGDFIKLPHGLYTQIVYDWGDQLQTGSGSFYLGDGYCQHSGGCDPGVKPEDLVATSEIKESRIWFFSNNYPTAHNGVDYNIPFRVYALKEGANLSGLPQIKEFERKEKLKGVPTIKRRNGNGVAYVTHLPRLAFSNELPSKTILRMENSAGIQFELIGSHFEVQPMTYKQFVWLMLSKSFKMKYYNNWSYENTLFLTPGMKWNRGFSEPGKRNKNTFTKDNIIRQVKDKTYILPLPQIAIQKSSLREHAIIDMENFYDWEFKRTDTAYILQPDTYEQIATLLLNYNFRSVYFNNRRHHNTLELIYDRY